MTNAERAQFCILFEAAGFKFEPERQTPIWRMETDGGLYVNVIRFDEVLGDYVESQYLRLEAQPKGYECLMFRSLKLAKQVLPDGSVMEFYTAKHTFR